MNTALRVFILVIVWVGFGAIALTAADDEGKSLYKWSGSAPQPWTDLFGLLTVLCWPIVIFVWRRRNQVKRERK